MTGPVDAAEKCHGRLPLTRVSSWRSRERRCSSVAPEQVQPNADAAQWHRSRFSASCGSVLSEETAIVLRRIAEWERAVMGLWQTRRLGCNDSYWLLGCYATAAANAAEKCHGRLPLTRVSSWRSRERRRSSVAPEQVQPNADAAQWHRSRFSASCGSVLSEETAIVLRRIAECERAVMVLWQTRSEQKTERLTALFWRSQDDLGAVILIGCWAAMRLQRQTLQKSATGDCHSRVCRRGAPENAGLGCSDSYSVLGCNETSATNAAEKCHGRLPLTRVSSWRSRERRCSSVAPEQVQRLGCSDSYSVLGCNETSATNAAEKCHGRLPLTRVSSWRSSERRCSSVAPEQVQPVDAAEKCHGRLPLTRVSSWRSRERRCSSVAPEQVQRLGCSDSYSVLGCNETSATNAAEKCHGRLPLTRVSSERSRERRCSSVAPEQVQRLGCSDSYSVLGCNETSATNAAEKCHGRLPLTRVSSWRSRERRCSSVAPEQVQPVDAAEKCHGRLPLTRVSSWRSSERRCSSGTPEQVQPVDAAEKCHGRLPLTRVSSWRSSERRRSSVAPEQVQRELRRLLLCCGALLSAKEQSWDCGRRAVNRKQKGSRHYSGDDRTGRRCRKVPRAIATHACVVVALQRTQVQLRGTGAGSAGRRCRKVPRAIATHACVVVALQGTQVQLSGTGAGSAGRRCRKVPRAIATHACVVVALQRTQVQLSGTGAGSAGRRCRKVPRAIATHACVVVALPASAGAAQWHRSRFSASCGCVLSEETAIVLRRIAECERAVMGLWQTRSEQKTERLTALFWR
ncbi:hypothetical protein e1012e08.tmp0241 [Eimeria tenella]|uniref:Uncharacterized protein n=1 Tax=Eimeria tenella TaxID=5802 RepID=C8TDM1_EIMTE|nr:hypothetical protein e1012e08.tmp0241 [Eimeria tenella]